MHPGFRIFCPVFILVSSFFFQPVLARIWFVKADAAGVNDGSSWTDAFLDLQDALGAAESGDEIWLAAGRYTPDRGTMDRTGVFRMMDGVPLYGGFAGWEECRDDRDWGANPTILSGDLNGDDGPHDCADFSDCCRAHEGITCDNLSCQERVCARRPGCCGNDPNQPPFTWDASCANFALRECCEIGNWRTCENSYIVVDATTAGSSYLLDGVHVAGAYETVTERYQVGFGGVGLNSADAELIVRNTGFEGNGSFAMNVARSANTIVNACSFFRNPDAGIVAENTNLAVDGCTFVENGTPIYAYYRATITNSVFEHNTGSGVYLGGDAAIANCAFIDNDGSRAVVHRNGQLDMADCKLIGNWGGVYNVDSSLTMTNCAILGSTWAGALTSEVSSAKLTNCILANGLNGWTIYQYFSDLTMINCAVAGNRNGSFHAGLYLDDSQARLTNCILWDNRSSLHGNEEDQIYLESYEIESRADIDHSIVQGWTGDLGGVGNFDAVPMFVDAFGPDGIAGTEDDDLRLRAGSPAINAGDPNVIGLPTTDLDGHARVLCGGVDIGAHEFGIGDFNCDQQIDMNDFAIWAACMTNPRTSAILPGCEAFDFNADSAIDLSDFAAFERAFAAP